DVTRVLGRPAADWREVILARPEQLFLALAQAPADEGGGLLGFAVRPDGWVLEREAPVLALPAGWREALAGLVEEPPPEAWRQAWQAWCQPRGVPAPECEACRLEPAGAALVVRAPRRLVERLRAARSDAVKGEAWLLAGAGRCRASA